MIDALALVSILVLALIGATTVLRFIIDLSRGD